MRSKKSLIKRFFAMMQFMQRTDIWNDANPIQVLKEDGVVVMPTDTLYGIVGKAENTDVVNRIYTIRKRNPDKPCIILIADISELKKFRIDITREQEREIKKFDETRPTSFILECIDEKFAYLHRGTKTLAFRVPAQKDLQNLLKQTGPLVAPSANLEGLPPAKNIKEAKKYFGDAVDFYVDVGDITSKASKVIQLHKDGSVEVVRD